MVIVPVAGSTAVTTPVADAVVAAAEVEGVAVTDGCDADVAAPGVCTASVLSDSDEQPASPMATNAVATNRMKRFMVCSWLLDEVLDKSVTVRGIGLSGLDQRALRQV